MHINCLYFHRFTIMAAITAREPVKIVSRRGVDLARGYEAYCRANRSPNKGCIQSNPIPRLATRKGVREGDNERAVSKYEDHKANLLNFCAPHSRGTPSRLCSKLDPLSRLRPHCDQLFKTRPSLMTTGARATWYKWCLNFDFAAILPRFKQNKMMVKLRKIIALRRKQESRRIFIILLNYFCLATAGTLVFRSI